MKLLATNISRLYKAQVVVVHRDEDFFTSPFHYHPEFELVHVIEGFGKRIIGNKIEDFQAGELLLIGPDVPHHWISDPSFYAAGHNGRCRSLAVYFNPQIFSDSFYQMSESLRLRRLFQKAESGIRIEGTTKEQVLHKIDRLVHAVDFEKIIGLLDILNMIAHGDDLATVTGENVAIRASASNRLSRLFEYIESNYQQPIRLKEAADMTNLTPESFCRFFKQKTGKNFLEYLHETRMSHACLKLVNTDDTIAEIAYQTGFRTASNFNRLFRKFTGYSPTEYRKSVTPAQS